MLKMAWVDRIFERLAIRYGERFLNRWRGIDLDMVKHDWATVLEGFEHWPTALSYALDNLDDEKPPTATQFRSIAQKAPKPATISLPAPKADPDRVACEFQKLASLRNKVAFNDKGWADAIINRHNNGDSVSITVLNMARNAKRYTE